MTDLNQVSPLALVAASFSIEDYATVTASYRGATVSEENKRSDWGRFTLFGLFSGAMTKGDLTTALLVAYKPVKPNGKAGDSLSALRYAKGGDAARKAAETCLDIVEAASEGTVADAFRPIAIAFATNSPDAPKSLKALKDTLSTLRRDAAKAAKGETASEGEGEGEAASEGEAPAPSPIGQMAASLALRLSEASPADILAADSELSDLLETLRASIDRAIVADDIAIAA